MALPENVLEYLDTLPGAQAHRLIQVLREFFDTARKATDISDVNVAAGIALEKLQ